MTDSVGQVALDIIMGKNTVADVVKTAMSDCQKVISDSSASMGTKIGAVGTAVSSVGGAILPASVAVIGLGTACANAALSFEDSMAKVTTIAGSASTEYNGSVQSMSDAMLELSNSTGIAAGDCAEATYQAISAGVDAANAVQFVDTANKLATGGFADLTTATDVLTTAINAYGLTTDDATALSDKLINTQNLGKTSVAELGSSLGKIIPTAAAYGVNIDNLCAGYVKMTANGVATAEATTYMNGMLNELGKSGTSVSDILKSKTGKSFADLIASGMSVGDVLGILQQYCTDTGTQFTDLWSSAEAGKAALILAKDGADGFNETLGTMTTCAGATDTAFDTMQTQTWDFNRVLNEVKNTAIDVGGTLMQTLGPVIQDVCAGVRDAVKWFNGLSDSQKELIVKIGLGVAAAGPALSIAGKGIKTIGSVVSACSTLGGGISTLVSGAIPMLGGLFSFIAANPIVLVIGGVIAAGVALATHWEEVSAVAQAVWGGICDFFSGVGDFLGGICGSIGSFFANTWSGICSTTSSLTASACSTVSSLWSSASSTVGGVLSGMHSTAGSIFSGILSGISGTMGNIVSVCTSGFNNAFNVIKGIPGQAVTWGADMIGGIVSGIKSMMGAVGDAVSGVAGKIRSFLHFSVPDEGPLTDYESWMPDFMQGMASGITDNIPLIEDAVSNTAAGMSIGLQAPTLKGVSGGASDSGGAQAATDSSLLVQILELLKRIAEGGNVDIPIYLDGKILDEYLVSRSNRKILRSGGTA